MAKANVFAAAEYLVIRRANRTMQKTVLYLMLYYAYKEYKDVYGEVPFDASFYKSPYGNYIICDEIENKFKKQILVNADQFRKYREDVDGDVSEMLDEMLARFATITSFDVQKLTRAEKVS